MHSCFPYTRFGSNVLVAGLCCLVVACSAREMDAPPLMDCRATPGATHCIGATALICASDGTVGSFVDCAAAGQLCVDGVGCAVCTPNAGACSGNVATRCRADGSGFDEVATCDGAAGEVCNPHSGACENPCAVAEASHSYIGCEYWPVMTLNSLLSQQDLFPFAVVIANPNPYAANITVSQGANSWTSTVAPGGLDVMELPWNEELRNGSNEFGTGSVIVPDGAFHLTSSVPVAAYQFNPLDFRTPSYCGGSASCAYSYTNDASLLLPAHVLTGNYTVVAYGGQRSEVWADGSSPEHVVNAPSMFAVTAAEDAVSVEVTFAAHAVVTPTDITEPGHPQFFAPGDTGTFLLNGGDVLEIISDAPTSCPAGSPRDETTIDGQPASYVYCDVGRDYDLTGSVIRATGRVQVTSGHDCAQVPFDKRRCDHLEETLYPEDTWGHNAIVSVTEPLRSEPNLIRVISGGDNNTVTFDPATVHGPVTLQHGEFLEFVTSADVAVAGSEPILVAQYMVSQQYAGFGTTEDGAPGDPSLSLAIPTEQFLNGYTFLAPESFDDNYVNVTAQTGTVVTLDGVQVEGFVAVGASGLGVAKVAIDGGTHSIVGTGPFGIVVYGYAAHTSYMYPGGLNLNPINLL